MSIFKKMADLVFKMFTSPKEEQDENINLYLAFVENNQNSNEKGTKEDISYFIETVKKIASIRGLTLNVDF